jgi:hypothetical protein
VGLLEGGNKDIMNYIAYNFEVSLLYTQTISLVKKCWVMEAKKKDIVQSLPKADQENMREKFAMHKSLSNRNSKSNVSRKDVNDKLVAKPLKIPAKAQGTLDALAASLVDDYQEKFGVTYKDEQKYGIKKWEDLNELYTQCEDFSENVVLKCANKLFAFIYKLAFEMQKYQIFLDNKERELKDVLKEAGFTLREIENKTYEMTGKSTSPEDIMIFYFMRDINIIMEIMTKRSVNEVMMFTKLPCTFFLSSTSKIRFTDTCPIDNTESKCTAMMVSINQFQIEMEFNKEFKRYYPQLLELSTDRSFKIFRVSIWLLGLLINLLNFIFVKEDRHIEGVYTGGDFVDKTVTLLNILMAIYGWLITSLWFVTRFPQIKLIEIDKYFLANHTDQLKFYAWAKIFFINSIFLQPEVISFFCHGFLGFMGVSISPIFTACNLLMIINISATTKYVLKSVVRHIDQLVSTFSLTIIIIWVFAMIVAEFYVNSFDWDGGVVGSVKICSSYYTCFLYILNLGVRFGGGIAEIMEVGSTTNGNFWGRLAFDLTFWMLINIISLNIIFGIIIDTFSELRDMHQERGNIFFS